MTGQAFDPGPPVDYAWAGTFLESYVSALTEGTISPFVEFIAEDATLHPNAFGQALEGSNAIRAYLLQRSQDQADLELTIERHWVSGATILAAWHASFVRQPNREHVREAGFLTAEIRSARCVRLRLWTETKAAEG